MVFQFPYLMRVLIERGLVPSKRKVQAFRLRFLKEFFNIGVRRDRLGRRAEILLWQKAGALDTKKPHRVMRLSLKWLPLRDSNLRHTD